MENEKLKKATATLIQALMALASAEKNPEFRKGINASDRKRYQKEYPSLFPLAVH